MILYYLILSVHIVVCLILITIILIQGGRGGLGETLGGGAAQSLFGGGTSTVIAKVTAFSGGAFMVTCLSLAMLSTMRGKSVIDQVPSALPGVLNTPLISEEAPISQPDAPVSAPETTAETAAPVSSEPAAVPSGQPEAAPAP